MSDTEDIVHVLRRGVADLDGERPEPAEIRDMLRGVPQEIASHRRVGTLAIAAAVVAVVTFALIQSVPEKGGATAFKGVELPLLRIDPGEGFSKEKYQATLVIREKDAELRLEYEPADGGSRTRVRTKWEPLPSPAGAKEDDLPALRIVADGAAPWHRVHRFAAPGMGSRISFYLTGRGEDGKARALPLLVRPPAEARRLGAAVTPADVGLTKHRGAFRALWIERRRNQVRLGIGPVGDGIGFDPERSRPIHSATTSVAYGVGYSGARNLEPGLMPSLAEQVARIERMPGSDGARSVVLVLASHSARVLDVLRAVELAAGDPGVLFWVSTYDLRVSTDGRGLAADLLRPWALRGGEVVVRVPVADDLRVDLLRRKGVRCAPDEIPFPEERFERLVIDPRAATPWARCRPAVLEARLRKVALEFKFVSGRVLPVPPVRGGQEPTEVRIGFSKKDGKLTCTPGEKELIGKDITVIASEEATAEDVFRTVQFLLWRGVVGVDFQ